MEQKACSKCGELQPLTNFYKHPTKKDGRRNDCISCRKTYLREYYNARSERMIAKVSVRRKESREAYLSSRKRAYHASDKIRTYNNNWKKSHRDLYHAADARRRARKKRSTGSFTASEFKQLCARYDYVCLCCCQKKKLAADHIVPLFKGGASDISNIQPLCRECNSSKGTKTTDYRTKGATDQ